MISSKIKAIEEEQLLELEDGADRSQKFRGRDPPNNAYPNIRSNVDITQVKDVTEERSNNNSKFKPVAGA